LQPTNQPTNQQKIRYVLTALTIGDFSSPPPLTFPASDPTRLLAPLRVAAVAAGDGKRFQMMERR